MADAENKAGEGRHMDGGLQVCRSRSEPVSAPKLRWRQRRIHTGANQSWRPLARELVRARCATGRMGAERAKGNLLTTGRGSGGAISNPAVGRVRGTSLTRIAHARGVRPAAATAGRIT